MTFPVVLVGAEFEENLSLRYLASALAQDGVDAVLMPFNDPAQSEAVVGEIGARDPAVVGISVPFQLRAREFLGLAQALRASGCRAHLTVGGHFATFEYDNILRDFPAIDSVVRHEGELTFRELVRRVRAGEDVEGLAGAVTRGPHGITDGGKRRLPALDDLQFPDRRGAPHDVMGLPSSAAEAATPTARSAASTRTPRTRTAPATAAARPRTSLPRCAASTRSGACGSSSSTTTTSSCRPRRRTSSAMPASRSCSTPPAWPASAWSSSAGRTM